MATIKEFNDRIQAFDINKVLMDVFMEQKAVVIDKNLDQLQYGFDSNGNRLKKYSQSDYAEYKNDLNPKAGFWNPDLKLTGQFWQSLYLEDTGGTKYEIKSDDSKASKLEEKYGSDIYGLSDEKAGEFVSKTYRPRLAERIKEILKLP